MNGLVRRRHARWVVAGGRALRDRRNVIDSGKSVLRAVRARCTKARPKIVPDVYVSLRQLRTARAQHPYKIPLLEAGENERCDTWYAGVHIDQSQAQRCSARQRPKYQRAVVNAVHTDVEGGRSSSAVGGKLAEHPWSKRLERSIRGLLGVGERGAGGGTGVGRQHLVPLQYVVGSAVKGFDGNGDAGGRGFLSIVAVGRLRHV